MVMMNAKTSSMNVLNACTRREIKKRSKDVVRDSDEMTYTLTLVQFSQKHAVKQQLQFCKQTGGVKEFKEKGGTGTGVRRSVGAAVVPWTKSELLINFDENRRERQRKKRENKRVTNAVIEWTRTQTTSARCDRSDGKISQFFKVICERRTTVAQKFFTAIHGNDRLNFIHLWHTEMVKFVN
jgi:hypothetical protein